MNGEMQQNLFELVRALRPDPERLSGARPRSEGARPLPEISVELATPQRFLTLEGAWRDLVSRAEATNVFIEPAFVAAAAERQQDAVVVLLAWDASRCPGEPRLLGAWALAVTKPSSCVPVKVLKSPVHGHAALGTPVVDAACIAPVLERMMQAVLREPGLPKIVEIHAVHASGPVADAIGAALAARRMQSLRIDPRMRPMLDREAVALPLSRSRAKALRQQRRRLEARGEVSLTVATEPPDISRTLEEFLALEQAGWKGRGSARGRAILLAPPVAAFFRRAVLGLSRRGLASIAALRVDGKPVAMQLVVTSGRTASTWKTAYDEAYRTSAPGLILLQAITPSLLDAPGIVEADSCNHRCDGYMAEFWGGRRAVADLLFDVRPGVTAGFCMVGTAGYLAWQGKRLARRLAAAARARAVPSPGRGPGLAIQGWLRRLRWISPAQSGRRLP